MARQSAGQPGRHSPNALLRAWQRLLILIVGVGALIVIAIMIGPGLPSRAEGVVITPATAAPVGGEGNSRNTLDASLSVVAASTPTPFSPTATPPQLAPPTRQLAPPSTPTTPPQPPLPTPTPLTLVEAPQTAYERVTAAETAVRSGTFVATIDYDNGVRSTTSVRFVRGGSALQARFHISSLYRGATATRANERVAIGEDLWEREGEDPWRACAVPGTAGRCDRVTNSVGSLWTQVQFLLPQLVLVPPATVVERGGELQWYDATLEADATLRIDPVNGTPTVLRRVMRSTGWTVTVVYGGWNAPTVIDPPSGAGAR